MHREFGSVRKIYEICRLNQWAIGSGGIHCPAQFVAAIGAVGEDRLQEAEERARPAVSYIEGGHTIAEANRIFGYDAWDRQTMAVKCVWEGMKPTESSSLK